MTPITLAIPYHDPPGALTPQLRRLLPTLHTLFSGIAVNASPEANSEGLALLAGAGAQIEQEARGLADGVPLLGYVRRKVVDLALRMGAERLFYYPAELHAVLDRLPTHDLTIYGRTPRAFASHPETQRTTEQIISDL